MNSDQDILNLISDIRSEVEESESLQDEIIKAEAKLQDDKDDLSDLKDSIAKKREKLEELIDEATGQTEDDKDFMIPRPSYGF